MVKLALIGKHVSGSFSPTMHEFLLKRMGESCTYEKISLPPEQFQENIEEIFAQYDGFNVTMPYKREILPFLNELCGDAQVFQSVNTVVAKTRAGYNTDGFGFLLMLQNEELEGKKVLVLGTGGAGRSAIKALTGAGAAVYAYNRTPERMMRVYSAFGDFTPLCEIPLERFDIIVNCTGIGANESVGQLPEVRFAGGNTASAEALLKLCDTAVDLIYLPKKSEFLLVAEHCGKRTLNGLAMLFFQAYRSDCIYLGRESSLAEAKKLWEEYREENQ